MLPQRMRTTARLCCLPVPRDHRGASPTSAPEVADPTPSLSTTTRARRTLVSKGAIAALGGLLTLFCWALSSPPGSSPDEPFHLASIWCGWGVDKDHCGADPDPSFRVLPHQVVKGQCFTGNPVQSAECRTADYEKSLTPDFPTNIGNWRTGYPPIYYAVLRTFVTHSYDTSVVLIRVVNAVIAVALVVGLMLLLPRRLRPLPGYVFLLTAVPLLLFFVASTNPSSWTIVSAGVLWLSVYAAYGVEGRRRWALLGLALVATVMGAGSRADGALFSILGVALAMGLQLRAVRRAWPASVAALAMIVLAGGLFLTAGHADVVAQGLPGYGHAPMSDTQLAISNVLQAPFLWLAALGAGPLSQLGWFDTPISYLTAFFATVAFSAAIVHGWGAMWWQKGVAVAVVAAGLLAYPVILLQESGLQAGGGIQPRYVLPMMLMLVGLSLLRRRGRIWRLNVFQCVVLAGGLAAAQSAALYANLVRYTNGGHVGLPKSMGEVDWWWDGMPVSPFWVWLIGTVAFAATAYVVLSGGVVRRTSVAQRPAFMAGDG
jgi:hypothetical protein